MGRAVSKLFDWKSGGCLEQTKGIQIENSRECSVKRVSKIVLKIFVALLFLATTVSGVVSALSLAEILSLSFLSFIPSAVLIAVSLFLFLGCVVSSKILVGKKLLVKEETFLEKVGNLEKKTLILEGLKGDFSEASSTIEELKRDFSEASSTIEELKRDFSEASSTIEELKRDFSEASSTIEELKRDFSETSSIIEAITHCFPLNFLKKEARVRSCFPKLKACMSLIQTLKNFVNVSRNAGGFPRAKKIESSFSKEDSGSRFEEKDYVPEQRSKRELMTALLGFLNVDQLEDINRMYKEANSQGASISVDWRNKLYVDCIKKYPAIVAAEGAYFSWVCSSFSYLGKAKAAIFQDSERYRIAFFTQLQTFVSSLKNSSKVSSFLENFSGLIPASLSIFSDGDSLEFSSELGWDTYCSQVAKFCDKTVFCKSEFYHRDLEDFIKNGENCAVLKGERLLAPYENELEESFFEKPRSLWDLKEFLADKEFLSKIEAGLSVLDSCGYLGTWSVGEIKCFEKIILGLVGSKDQIVERKEKSKKR
ncbi:hypothetical protein [Chlamydiifrater phoenicopteri]|uniref:hypothetical protein n=1 Tax=Chlamydiifrater phoenicopteri TaxID=2681469 RepID=UPI001BD14DA8|nr:hypothetical protein [Chlamydiifrater phoenicopteri]